MDNSFGKRFHIKSKNDFIGILKNGKSVKDRFYYCKFIENDLGYNRLGILIKKKLGNAVERNYEKRVLREFFRLNKECLNSGCDVVISVYDRKGSFAEKKGAFERILLKIQQNDN
jgi:ribonuclease P protein component